MIAWVSNFCGGVFKWGGFRVDWDGMSMME